MSKLQASLIQFKKANICPLEDGRNIIRSEFREGCFSYQSFSVKRSDYGDLEVSTHFSFLADGGNGSAAEWEPKYGPIQVWTECTKDWVGKTAYGNDIKPRTHWHFPFVQDNPGSWSQLAVDSQGLKGMLRDCDFDAIFDVLMSWAKSNTRADYYEE